MPMPMTTDRIRSGPGMRCLRVAISDSQRAQYPLRNIPSIIILRPLYFKVLFLVQGVLGSLG